MKPERAWIRLGSGKRLDLICPQPDQWEDRDLAIGLSRTYRWGGHSRWDLPMSVAQHSLLVLVLRQQMQPHRRLTPREALREVLHDGEGGFKWSSQHWHGGQLRWRVGGVRIGLCGAS